MTPVLLRIALAAVLAFASLFVIIFKVSPLTSPGLAIPLFFVTVFLSAASLGTLAFYGIWSGFQLEGMDAGRRITVSLREGVFLASATVLLLIFQILGILTWWVGVLIYAVFLLVELALQS